MKKEGKESANNLFGKAHRGKKKKRKNLKSKKLQ
jgi:hypothetical protein